MNLILYSSENCELCDHAEQLIHQTLDGQEYSLQHVDILSSLELKKRYGLKIPVLVRQGNETDALFWPFSAGQILELVTNASR